MLLYKKLLLMTFGTTLVILEFRPLLISTNNFISGVTLKMKLSQSQKICMWGTEA